MNGPSFPMDNPEPSPHTNPKIFATKHRNDNGPSNIVPARMVFISGVPLPLAYTLSFLQHSIAIHTQKHPHKIERGYAAMKGIPDPVQYNNNFMD